MHTIIYISKVDDTLASPEIIDILNCSQLFNHQNDITGCLLHHRGLFIQLLEGPRDTLEELYDKAESDHRHSQVRLLFSGTSNYRLFKNWYTIYDGIDSFSSIPHEKQGLFRQIISETNIIPNYAGSPYFTLWKYSNLILKENCSHEHLFLQEL